MVLGSLIVKSLIGNLLDKLGSDILGNWNLSENIEINSFSPLDIELRNIPIPQILFEISDLPFIIIYSNIRKVKIRLNTDNIPNKDNPLNIEAWDLDIQLRLANLDEWDPKKWCKRLFKSKIKKLKKWYKYVSPWSKKQVLNAISQSIETSLINSLNIKIYNIHGFFIDDNLGPSSFVIELLSDSFCVSSPNDKQNLTKEELKGKENNLFQFIWLRFYGLRLIYRRFDHLLLTSVPKHVLTELVDIGGDTPTNIEDDDENNDHSNLEKDDNSFNQSSFLYKAVKNLFPFLFSENSDNQKLGVLNSLVCNKNKDETSKIEYLKELKGLSIGSKEFNVFDLPKHTQNGNNKFIKIPEDLANTIQLTRDEGVETHIFFKRWDIRALNASSSMFGSLFADDEQVSSYISSREWKVSKLLFLPSSSKYLKNPPTCNDEINEPFEIICTKDIFSVLFNFVNYFNQWSSFLKASQYIYNNRRTRKKLEEYLSSIVSYNQGNSSNLGLSRIPWQFLSELEVDVPLRDIIALHMSANEFLKEGSFIVKGFCDVFNKSNFINSNIIHQFVSNKALNLSSNIEFYQKKDLEIQDMVSNANIIDSNKLSTFNKWFSHESKLQIYIPYMRLCIVMTEMNSIALDKVLVPDWMKPLLTSKIVSENKENIIGKIPGIFFEFDLNLITDKISFYHRLSKLNINSLSIFENEVGLISSYVRRNNLIGKEDKLIQKIPNYAIKFFILSFLPSFKILELGSQEKSSKTNPKDDTFNNLSYFTNEEKKLKIIDIDNNEVDCNTIESEVLNNSKVGFELRIHQLFGCMDLTNDLNRHDNNIPGFTCSNDYFIILDDELPHFNSTSLEISDLKLFDFKAIWKIASLIPNVTSNLASIISRSHKEEEIKTVSSLMKMINIATKSNSIQSMKLQNMKFMSRIPNCVNVPFKYTVKHLYLDKHLHNTSNSSLCLGCFINPKLISHSKTMKELNFSAFKVRDEINVIKEFKHSNSYSKKYSIQYIQEEKIEKKVTRIISEILLSPEDFLHSLKTYRVIESSQSLFRGFTDLTLNSSIGNMNSYDFEDEDTDQISESLLYNEILRYLLQNEYFFEENISFTDIEIEIDNLFSEIAIFKRMASLNIQKFSISMLSANKFKDEVINFLCLKNISFIFCEKNVEFKFGKISLNIFPAIMIILNLYELLIFPKKGSVNFGCILDNISSFIDEDKNNEPANNHQFIMSLEILDLKLEEFSIQIYDSEYLIYQINFFQLLANYKFNEKSRHRVSLTISLDEFFVQSINNVKLKDQISEYQQLKKEFKGKTFYTSSVLFSKYSGHLVPSNKFHCKKKNNQDKYFPYRLVYSDFQSDKANEIQVFNDPIFYLDLKIRVKDHDSLIVEDDIFANIQDLKTNNFSKIDSNKYIIIVHSKVKNGHFFFSDNHIIRFKSILSLYNTLFNKFNFEKNILSNPDHTLERESPFEFLQKIKKKDLKQENNENQFSDPNSCQLCGGYKKELMLNSKNTDEYLLEFILNFENFYVHLLLNTDKLYSNKLIENKLLDIHRDTIEYSNESFTIVRPLYFFNEKLFDKNKCNLRTAILTAESIGARFNFCINFSLFTALKNDDSEETEERNSSIREWSIKMGFKEMNIMILRNGTWGMLDFSLKKLNLKLFIIIKDVFGYIDNEKGIEILNRISICIKQLFNRNGRKVLRIKFKIKDICIWSILYERINNSNSSKQFSTVDMYYTTTSSSTEYICMSPLKNTLSEFSTSLLPEFITIDRKNRFLSKQNLTEELFPSWEYGLNLPLPVPFNNQDLLLRCKPKIFPIFGKRPISKSELPTETNDDNEYNGKKNNCLINKTFGEIYIIPILSLKSNEIDLENTISPVLINLTTSPTFFSIIPLIFRQFVDIFYMFDRFKTLNLNKSSGKKSSEVNKGTKKHFETENTDTISSILSIFKSTSLTSLEIVSRFNTMIIIFPEFNDSMATDSISSRYFEVKSKNVKELEKRKIFAKKEQINKRNDDYYISVFSDSYHPALAMSHNFKFSFNFMNIRNFDDIYYNFNATERDEMTEESIKISLEISQLRLQLPFIKNIGGNYNLDNFKKVSSTKDLIDLNLMEDYLEDMDPILDIFVPLISSCFILSKNISVNNKSFNSNINGLLFGIINIPILFAIDGARIPVMDDTFVLRDYALRKNERKEGFNDDTNLNDDFHDTNREFRYEAELKGDINDDDDCFNNCMMNRPELLSIVMNIVGDDSLQIQVNLNNFRFIFSLTTFSVSAHYIKKIYSWWNDIWLIRMRYPRCENSTMRYFIVDSKNDQFNISSFGLTLKSNNFLDLYNLNNNCSNGEFIKFEQFGTNEIYSINRFDYLKQEITSAMYYPLDETIPIVAAFPITSTLYEEVKPWNSLEYKSDDLIIMFNQDLKNHNSEILLEGQKEINKFVNVNKKNSSNYKDKVSFIKVVSNPLLVCKCSEKKVEIHKNSLSKRNLSNSESNLLNEINEFNSEEEQNPIKYNENSSFNLHQSIHQDMTSNDDYLELCKSEPFSKTKKIKKPLFSGWNTFKNKISSNTYNPSLGELFELSNTKKLNTESEITLNKQKTEILEDVNKRRKSFNIFRKRSSKDVVSNFLSPIRENEYNVNNFENDYKDNENENNVSQKVIKLQISLNNLELWFHRDTTKDNDNLLNNRNHLNEEIKQLTLEEVSVDWMSKAVYCVPITKNNKRKSIQKDQAYKVQIAEHLNILNKTEDTSEEDYIEDEDQDHFYDANENESIFLFKNEESTNSIRSRKLFMNSYEIFSFRKNVSTYDQADYDYIINSSRYGKRQGLAVHRYLKPSTSNYYIPVNNNDSFSKNDFHYKIKKDGINSHFKKFGSSKLKEDLFLNGTAFSLLLNLEINVIVMKENFQFSAECNEIRILPGFPVKIKEEQLIKEKIMIRNKNDFKKNCNCNYCYISLLRRYMYLSTLNGRNIYITLGVTPDQIKRDFLVFLDNFKVFVVPSGIKKSKISESWTNYQMDVETSINELTISISMDILQEIKLFNNYFKEVKESILYYPIWNKKNRKDYLTIESILNPFCNNNQLDSNIEDLQINSDKEFNNNSSRKSILKQVIPTINNVNDNEENNDDELIFMEGILDEQIDEIENESNISDSSKSLDSLQENQVILIYYSGFPLPNTKLNYIPESVKRHLKQEQLGYLDRHRRFGIFAPKLVSNDKFGNEAESVDSIIDSGKSKNKEQDTKFISDNALYSVISNIISYTSIPLEWIFKGLKKNEAVGTSNIFKKYKLLTLLTLPNLHFDRNKQIKIEYRLSSFNIILHNDYINILKLTIEKTLCVAEFPNNLNCKLNGIIGAITHDPIMDCMITIIRPFPFNLDLFLDRNKYSQDFGTFFISNEYELTQNENNIYVNNIINSSPLLIADFCTESISLEITSGFLQNIKLLLTDYENSHLLGLVYAYERRINTVKIINDIGQSSLIVQPVSILSFKNSSLPISSVINDNDEIANKNNINTNLKMVNNKNKTKFNEELNDNRTGKDICGLKNYLLESGEYCNVSINLPVYMAIQKFTHRKGQKIAARLQANKNSDYWKNFVNYKDASDDIEYQFNGFLNITSSKMNKSIKESGNRNNSIKNKEIKDVIIEMENLQNDDVHNSNDQNKSKEKSKLKNNSNIILNDIINELCTLGISKRKKRLNVKHLWLEDKKSDLLYGSTGIAESELKQLAEQLELSTPVLGMNTEGVDMMIHRFLISQSSWSSLGKLKDDTLYRRAYRLGMLGFLIVLEPESGIYSNEWIWTLGTCVQIENATNMVFRVTANWRHGIRHLCGTIFTEPSKRNKIKDEIHNKNGINNISVSGKKDMINSTNHHFPCIDIPPYSRKSIPLSWFLLTDMEPTIIPLLNYTDFYEDEDEEDERDDESDYVRDTETEDDEIRKYNEINNKRKYFKLKDLNKRKFNDNYISVNKKNLRENDKIKLDKKSIHRIQSRLHSIPFTILKMLIYEIMSTQPGNVTKAKLTNEITTLTFESLMAFNCQVECMDIPTSDKYVTSYSYSIKITPLLKLMNSLPFPIQIRLKMSGGIKIPIKNMEISDLEIPNIVDFTESRLKSLVLLENSLINKDSTSAVFNKKKNLTKKKIKRNKNSNYNRLKRVYNQEFAALIQFLNGKSIDYIIQSQQELELPICRQKIDLIVYVNGCPLEYCCYPLFTNTTDSVDYIQSRNASISEFIYRSSSISISFPFGSTITQNINLKRISGNPFNAWNPFYSQLLQGFFNTTGNSNKLIEALNNFTISISTSSKRILFSILSRIENTSDSIICLFFNDITNTSHYKIIDSNKAKEKIRIMKYNRNYELQNDHCDQEINNNVNNYMNVLNLSTLNNLIVPLPPMYRYFTTIENLKSVRISSLTIDFIDKNINIPSKIQNGINLNELNKVISNNILINYVSKVSSKYDFSSIGSSFSIKLPLTVIDETNSSKDQQTLAIGSTTHNNDLLSQLNCPFVSFYNKYEFVSQLPFPIIIHKFTNSKEMHQTIKQELTHFIDLETEFRDSSVIYFKNHKNGALNSTFNKNNKENKKKLSNGNKEEIKDENENMPMDTIDLKLPPKTSLSYDGILLKPNERRPYHDNDPKVWICKPLVEGSNELFQASREFSLFSGHKLEYTPQLSKFQVALHPQQNNQNLQDNIGPIISSQSVASSDSDYKSPLLITIQIIPAILGSTASGSTTLRDSAYFVIFSVAEAPFFEICNFSNYYIAYDTPEVSKSHNYYYRSKKAVLGAVTGGANQVEDLSRSMNIEKNSNLNNLNKNKSNKKLVYVNHFYGNGYVYPDIFSAKSADISVIPPHTKIPYIPKNWDCEFIGIRPFNVRKSVWTTHSITSIKDQISVISFTKLNERSTNTNQINEKYLSSVDSLLSTKNKDNYEMNNYDNFNRDKNQINDPKAINKFQNPFTAISSNGFNNSQSKIRTGKLYLFLMVNSKGTRVLTIMDNKKYAEKLLSGNMLSLSNNIFKSNLNNQESRELKRDIEYRKKIGNSNNSENKNKEDNQLNIQEYDNKFINKMKKISWLGLKISFFIPRTSISWIHQNELVLVSHGSLFHISVNILPQNVYPISILNLTCDSLMSICLKLIGFTENQTYERNEYKSNQMTLKNNQVNIPNKKRIKTLFTQGVTNFFTYSRRKNLSEKIQIDQSNSQMKLIDSNKESNDDLRLVTKNLSSTMLNVNLFASINNNIDERQYEFLSDSIKQIYQFLNKNLIAIGGSVSPKENPTLNNVLKMLRKVYKDCITNEKHFKKRFVNSKYEEDFYEENNNHHHHEFTSSDYLNRTTNDKDKDNTIDFEMDIGNKYFELYDGVLGSLLQIIVLISNFIEHTILMSGKVILKIGLSSIHIDHFLPGDIPVILKTSSISIERTDDEKKNLTDDNKTMENKKFMRNNNSIIKKNKYDDIEMDDIEQVELEEDENNDELDEINHNYTTNQPTNDININNIENNKFISLTIARSLMNPMYAPIFDEILITVSQICCNLERLVVQTLYFMVSKEFENMNNITYSRQKTLWIHSTRQKMVKKRNYKEHNYLGSLVCYVSGGYSLPMYITRTPWDQLKIGKPLYIRTLEISDIVVTISIRTSDDTIDIDTLTPEALLFMNILPLDTPHMILNVNSLHKDALVVDIAEFFHFLISSYSRQLKRRVLPSLGVTHLVAVYSGLKRGVKAVYIEIKRGLSDDDLTYVEGFIQGFRVGLIHFFRYFLGGTFQTASVIFNFGHKLLGGRRPRPKSILDAIWNGIVGLLLDTFVTPWILLIREPTENFKKTNKKLMFVFTLIFSIIRILVSPIFGLLNLFASITESLATTLIGDFEQFAHVQSRSELMTDIEKDRLINQDEVHETKGIKDDANSRS